MSVMDDIKTEWEKMRERPLQERIQYFLNYYKWCVVAVVAVLAVIATILVGNLLKKEPVLNGVMLNSSTATSESAFDDFSKRYLEETGLDSEEVEMSLISNMTYRPKDQENAEGNYAAVQMLAAQTAGALLDFVIGDLSTIQNLGYSSFFADLSEVLTEEQMQHLAPYMCYIDIAVIEAIEKAVDAGNFELDIKIPDCKKPEEMQKPMAAFLDVSSSGWFEEIYPYATEPVVFAVAVNAPHREAIVQLIDCLLPQQK